MGIGKIKTWEQSKDRLDEWQSSKLSTGSRVESFLRAFSSSTDVLVLLLNQPNIVTFQENFLTTVDPQELMLSKSDMSNGTLSRAVR